MTDDAPGLSSRATEDPDGLWTAEEEEKEEEDAALELTSVAGDAGLGAVGAAAAAAAAAADPPPVAPPAAAAAPWPSASGCRARAFRLRFGTVGLMADSGYEQSRLAMVQLAHAGFCSSHLTWRFLQARHPWRDFLCEARITWMPVVIWVGWSEVVGRVSNDLSPSGLGWAA